MSAGCTETTEYVYLVEEPVRIGGLEEKRRFLHINRKYAWADDDVSGNIEGEKSAQIKGKQLKIAGNANEFFLEKFRLLLTIIKSSIGEAGLAALLSLGT